MYFMRQVAPYHSSLYLDNYKCRFQMMPGIYEYHRWTPGNMVQQINSCSDILFLSKNTCSDLLYLSKKSLITYSLLTASLLTSSSCPSTLGRSVSTSPYLGDVGREKRSELRKTLNMKMDCTILHIAPFNQLTTCTKGAPSSWQWQGKAEDSLYCALYPRAWTVYNLPKVGL